MAGSTNKKVLVARFDRETLQGFMGEPGPGDIELLTPEGALLRVPLSETKAVCFVRDFEGAEGWTKHRAFHSRPKQPGLWVRFFFRDGDTIEGMLPNNLLVAEPGGFSVVPPAPTFQNQRVFIPREALTGVQVLGVIGSPLRKRPKAAPGPDQQLEMF